MAKKIYLAGPDVFAPDARQIGRRKIEMCKQKGLQAVFPGDLGEMDFSLSRFDQGLYIYDITEKMLKDCDAMIVNMTPFHGPSMDAGSAFEMGFMRAQNKPIFSYSNSPDTLADRVIDYWNDAVATRENGQREGLDRMAIEEFDMNDNLMLTGSVHRSTGISVLGHVEQNDIYRSLLQFEECVLKAAEWFKQ